jgi:hypothetical protein
MKHKYHFAGFIGTTVALLIVLNVAHSAINPGKDWPGWRGPTQNGIAASGQTPAVEWNETQNIRWQASIPGYGHGTPTVVGDRIFFGHR